MFRKILLYGLPVYLYALELFLRAVANLQTESLAGPTLAGAGIGFLLPLTDLKRVQIDANLAKALEQAGAKAYYPRDRSFSDSVWVAFFLSLFAWMGSLYLSIQHSRPGVAQPVNWSLFTVNWSLFIGCTIFVMSIVLSEIKERIK